VIEDLSECYRVLELVPGASPEDVKRSYRELVMVWHPDRFANDPKLQKKAQEKLKQINLAH
jgi:curved DNA-binding protein CbpA